MVFFAGLPGTGKSFFAHRLAELAHAGGRPVSFLLWDVVRPAFEGSPAGLRYPMRDGITQPVIRKAAGVWARGAVVRWHRCDPGPAALLIGETPLVGHRFIELARPDDDPAEPLLAAATCAFVLPVPSVDVRRFLEEERKGRSSQYRHAREREDAVPAVVRTLWHDLVDVSRALGIAGAHRGGGEAPYDPELYARVYRRVLVHRHTRILRVERREASPASSVYAFAFPTQDVVPAPGEADEVVRAIEARYPDPRALEREIEGWYRVSPR